MTQIRCKFVCESKTPIEHSIDGAHKVRFDARYHPETPEDQRFTKATPWGTLDVAISNPTALAAIEVGKAYYLDLCPAD